MTGIERDNVHTLEVVDVFLEKDRALECTEDCNGIIKMYDLVVDDKDYIPSIVYLVIRDFNLSEIVEAVFGLYNEAMTYSQYSCGTYIRSYFVY